MTDVSNIIKKIKKPALPQGWVERISKKHPDRPFYFNQDTGERSWSPPLEPLGKDDPKSQSKGKKRKTAEADDKVATAGSAASSHLLAALRPKLKAKSVASRVDITQKLSNDTPQMRLLREKKAQRTAALETMKGKSPTSIQSSRDLSISLKNESRAVLSKIPNQKSQRSKSESSDSYSSICSNVSTSSLGAQIKAAAVSIQNSSKMGDDLGQRNTRSLPRIPKKSSAASTVSPPSIKLLTNRESSGSQNKSEEVKNCSADAFDQAKLLEKNTANKRLKNLRRSLITDEEKVVPTKRVKESASTSNNNYIESNFDESKFLNLETPILHKETQYRLYHIESRVQNSGRLMIQKNLSENGDEENSQSARLLDRLEAQQQTYCEEMEWEPIEVEKITNEVHSVRYQLCERAADDCNEPCDFSGNVLQNQTTSTEDTPEKNSPYIVVDTNVLLSNLPFIEGIRDSQPDVCGKPFIVIPWTVLQELDFIKDDKSNTRSQSVQLKARKAVEFLNKHFGSKDPRFLGQTPQDVKRNKEKFEVECPDDEILQTCLQIKESLKLPVLLSYDKNLCTKAMIHDIPILGRDDPLEKIFRLKSVTSAEFLSNSLHAHIEEESQNNASSVHKELLAADDIMEEAKAVIKAVFSEVVSKEMENLFGSRWEMHVIIRPPWTINTVLKCAIKHWMAAVSEAFARKAEPMLRDLQVCINNSPEEGRRLQDVKCFLDKCTDISQLLNNSKYPELKKKTLDQLDVLRKSCSDKITEFSCNRFKETVGVPSDANEEERRSSLAFKVFEEIYAFSRDICGIASAALGLQCAFSYTQIHPFITPIIALKQHQDIGASVNRLLQHMRIAMLKMTEGIHPDDKAIIDLYEALVYFSSDLSFEELARFVPLDVYCCLKLKRPKLEKGYDQLHELSLHLCRLANQQCK